MTIAAKDEMAVRLQASLGSASFRPCASDDLTGVALGGAAKNVYAIACGVVEGMGLGENARAALLARSFAELARLGERWAPSAKPDGPVGIGRPGADRDQQILAQFFLRRGAGRSVPPAGALAEGVATASALVARAKAVGVGMPIAEAMADLLGGAVTPGEAVLRLMGRPLKAEKVKGEAMA